MTLDEAIKENKEDLKIFISKYEEELNNNDFETIYRMNNTVVNRAVTALLLKININPLKYMDYIPMGFAAGLNIEKFIIPANVTSIGYWAFEDCVNLSSITIPDSVTSIYPDTFHGCSSLTKITIPNSVTSIGYTAFKDCESLTDVYYEGSEEDWKNIKINGLE